MTHQFDEPGAGGDILNPRDVIGNVLIVHPLEYCTGIITKFSRTAEGSDAIKVDVVNLDKFNVDGSQIWRGALWFQGRLIRAMKTKIGKLMIGRITMGMGQPGQNQPFDFESLTGDTTIVARAQMYLQGHPEFLNGDAPIRQQQPQQPQQQQIPQATQQQQQTVLQRLQRQASTPYPANSPTSGPGTYQGFQDSPPF